jgi:hypothetical protein
MGANGGRPAGVPLWRRRIGLVILVAGLGYIVIRLLQAQPVDVEVVYHYGAASTRLERATMRYLQEGEELRRVSFRYDQRGAGATQHHPIQIPRGEYRVHLELVYRGQAPEELRGRRRSLGGERQLLNMSLPLIVSGEGRVDLFVGGPKER